MDESINQVVATQHYYGVLLVLHTLTPCARLIIIFGNLNQHFSPADWIGLYLPRGAMDLAVSITIPVLPRAVKRGSPLRLMMDSSGFRPIKYVQHNNVFLCLM